MQGQSEAKILNRQIGNMVIISDIPQIIGIRKRYLTKCLICNKESYRRLDHINGKNVPKYCKYCKDKQSANPKEITPFNAIYNRYKANAKTRNLEFNLTKDQVLNIMLKECNYCGDLPLETLSSKRNNRTNIPFLHNGLDRIDSKIGYTINNVVSCCGTCNLMKNKFNLNIFFDKVTKIYNKCLK